jgi:GNAT superfamily N-acetyltransferase
VQVREATPADQDQIEAMIHELAAFERAADEVAFDSDELGAALWGPSPAAHVLVADPAGGAGGEPAELAGMAVWFPTFSTWVGRPGIWLEDLFVRPAHRRAGVASALLAGLAERTTGRVEWQVLDWNVDAIALYEGYGATPVDGWIRYRLEPGRGRRAR